MRASGELTGLSDAGLALIAYQHGDYIEAAGLFGALPASVDSEEADLFEANSWLYAGRFDTAIASFDRMLSAPGVYAPAAYNNMGVAYFNVNKKSGLDQFDQAVDSARKQGMTEIGVLALVNRSHYHRAGNSWEKAREDCGAALMLNGQSALPYVCLASYNLVYYRFQSFGALPLSEIDRNLNEAEKYGDAPPLVDYLRANWHLSFLWKNKTEAARSYMKFLQGMENRACLLIENDYVSNAKVQVEKLTYP
jgi:tetratricopeptide (TPR) repeat protein